MSDFCEMVDQFELIQALGLPIDLWTSASDDVAYYKAMELSELLEASEAEQ